MSSRTATKVRGPLLAVAFIASAGCASLLGIDGYGGASAEAPLDAGDAAPAETGPSFDAADGSIEASGCRGVDASFCVDFEDDRSITGAVWSEVNPSGDAGILSLTSDAWVSPPRAVSFVVPASAPICSYLRMTRRFPGDHARLRTRLSVRAETEGVFFVVTAGSSLPSTIYQLLVSLDSRPLAQFHLQKVSVNGPEEVGSAETGLATSALGRWIAIEIDVAVSTGIITAVVDGVATAGISVPSDFVLSAPIVSAGPWCTGSAMRVLVDDVSVTVTP